MIVRESISFERGKNPKSVLDIGSKKYFIEQFRQLFMWDEENGREDNGLIYNVDFNRYGDLIAIGFDTKNSLPDSSRENIKYLRKLFKQFGLTDYINLSPVKVQHGVGAVYYAFNLSKVGEDLGMKSKRLWMQFGTEIIESDHVSHLFERSWYDAPPIDEPLPPIDESINFERGKDPKKAMEVGYFKDKNGRIIEIGDNVYVEGILEEDDFSDFQGMVDSFHGEYVTVRDMQGDYFDVEPHKLEIIQDQFTHDATVMYTFTHDATLGESVNFEREKDPKKSIGIGIKDQIIEYQPVSGSFGWTNEKQIEEFLNDPVGKWEKYQNKNFPYKGKQTTSAYGSIRWIMGEENYNNRNPHKIHYIKYKDKVYPLHNGKGTVYESVNFERGRDPKRAMEVGIYDKLPRIVGGDYYMEGDEMRMGPKQIKAVLDDAFNPAEWEKDYGFHVVWPDGKEDYMFLEDIVKNPDIDYIASHGEIFDVAMKVYEGISFERGKDPRASMDIGEIRSIERGLENLRNDYRIHDIWVDTWQGKPCVSIAYDLSEGWNRVNKAVEQHLGFKWFDLKLGHEGHLPGVRNYFIKPEYKYLFKISESVNFERGRDPRSSMEIGEKQRALNAFNHMMTLNNRPNSFRVRNGWLIARTHLRKAWITDSLKENGLDEFIELPGKVKSPGASSEKLIYYKVRPKWRDILEGLNSKDLPWFTDRYVRESVSFERGKDPKDKMRIGNKYYHELEIDGVYETRGRGIEPFTSYNSRLEGYDERTFFRNCEAGFFPMNIGVKPVGEDIVIPSDMLKELGIEQLVFNDEITELG